MNQPPHPHQHQIPPHIVVLADSSLALAAEWDQLLTEYLFPMLRALMQAPGGTKEPVKIRIAVVTYAASSVRPSPLVTKQFFAEPQILRDLQLEPHKLGIGQHPAAPHGLAALEGFVAAIELLDLIRECIPLKDGFPLHIFHLAAAHKDAAHAPRWNDAPALDGVAWDGLPGELRKRNIHLSTICVGKLAEFAELYKQATPESDATHPWFPTRPAHQVLISGLSPHPTHPAQLAHPNQPSQPIPPQATLPAHPTQPTHTPAHLPTQPQPPQPSQSQTPAVPATGAQSTPQAPQAPAAATGTGTGTPTHAKRTHELAQTERPQADVKRAKPSPEKSSPMVAPALPPGPAGAPPNAPANALPSTTGPSSGLPSSAPSASGSSATTVPPTTTTATTATAPGPSSGPAPTGPSKPPAALPALPAGLSPQQFGRYRHLLEAKLHSIKAKLDALGRGEAAGEGEVEALKKQFEQTGRQLVAFSEFMKVHVARAGGVTGQGGQAGAGGEQAQAQGETPSGQTAPALTSSPAQSNHPPPPQPPQQQDAPKPETAQTQQQPKPTASPAQFPMPPPNQVLNQSQTQNLNPNPNTLGHQRQRSMQDLQRGVGDGNNGGGNGAGGGGVPGNPSPSLMNRMPSGPPNPNTHQQGPESQGGRRGWQGIFSWSGLDPNTQERKEVQTMVSAVFPDEARANQARPETWPTNLTLHPTTDRAVSQLDLRAWLARYTPGLCTFQNVPQDARQNEVNFRSLISLLLAKNIYATASWSAPGGAHVTPNMLIFPTNNNILCGAVFPLTGIPELPKPTPQPPVPAGPSLPNFTNQMRQQFARMTPEQRQNFMLVARQRQLLSQQQQQGQGQGFAPPNMMSMQGAGIPLMGGMAGMTGKPGGGFPGAAGMAGVQPGLANMMQRFGLPPGTSAEQMQAFLQNNFGGGNSNQLP